MQATQRLIYKKHTPHFDCAAPVCSDKEYAPRGADDSKNTAALMEEISRLKRFISDLEIENRTDILTGLLNRRGFITELNTAWDRWVRYAVPTTLIVLDMNRFKQINDNYGHEAGDKALKLVAVYLQNNLRSTDILGRLGGDEFAVILPHTNAQETQTIINKLLQATPVLQMNFSQEQVAIPLEFALGFAEVNTSQGPPKAWLQAADLQMYQSKAATAD
ncbi:GGDEF domain-containing protein [Undibacterium sp. TC9W]|uniref:GGDEF domain-containing protein n=1 Tax=Undibacterium sp. TC9W TaxID=3413053 RepID=UPI003BF3AF6F